MAIPDMTTVKFADYFDWLNEQWRARYALEREHGRAKAVYRQVAQFEDGFRLEMTVENMAPYFGLEWAV